MRDAPNSLDELIFMDEPDKNEKDELRCLVIEKIIDSGIADEDEIWKILKRDYPQLLLTERELDNLAAEDQLLELNRESTSKNGYPYMIAIPVDGGMKYKSYRQPAEGKSSEPALTRLVFSKE